MSDLSWLNPTPHTIAVYASRPLSPVAAQHSLPSGRYSLLGPDFHRLDRTSLRLAHSFDHLVGALLEEQWHVKADRLRGPEVDRQHELGGLLHGQIARLFAAKYAVDVTRGAPCTYDPTPKRNEIGGGLPPAPGTPKCALRRPIVPGSTPAQRKESEGEAADDFSVSVAVDGQRTLRYRANRDDRRQTQAVVVSSCLGFVCR